jgi:DNA repair exonuclease SbcCD ATPase subunit
MADDAFEELSRRLAVLVAKLDSTYDELLEANRAQREFNQEQREFNQEQREFNRRQVEINERLEITQARIETLIARMLPSSENGRDA